MRELQADGHDTDQIMFALGILDGDKQEKNLPKTFREAFHGQRSTIENRLDTRHGLLGELLQRQVLLPGHIEDICQAGNNDYDRADRLMNVLERRPDDVLVQFYNALHVTGQHDLLQLIRSRGECQWNVKRLTRLTADEDLMGVTKLDNRIYAVHRESNIIAVFTAQQPFRRLHNIVVDGLLTPTDITASINSRCLYVPDDGSEVVWRINVADGAAVEWLSEVDVAIASMAADERLVLLVRVDIQGSFEERTEAWHGEVHIYRPDAVREAVIRLPDIMSPLHAVMTKWKTVIVSYGYLWHEVNGVCEVDMNGRVLKSFASQPGNGVNQLKMPCHLSLTDDDQIIVADSHNTRLMLLNKQLTSQRVLVSWGDVQSSSEEAQSSPWALHYDNNTGRLLVGLDTGHVDVFKLA